MTTLLHENGHERLNGAAVPREWIVVARTRPRDLLEPEWDWADAWDRYLAERSAARKSRARRELGERGLVGTL